MYERVPKDSAGNVLGKGVQMVDEVTGSVILCSDPEKLVVARGFENLMVVDMDDVLLVCRRDDRTVKDIVTDLTMKDKIDRYL